MIELEYEMTYAETIDGPLGPTTGSPLGDRLCWQITTATLAGPADQRHASRCQRPTGFGSAPTASADRTCARNSRPTTAS